MKSLICVAAGAALAFRACTPSASTAPSALHRLRCRRPRRGCFGVVAPSVAVGASRHRQLCSSSGRRRPQLALSAAQEQGYDAAENLTLNMLPGGPTVIPQAVGLAGEGPEFTISWVPKVLEAREQGSDDLAPHRPDLPWLRIVGVLGQVPSSSICANSPASKNRRVGLRQRVRGGRGRATNCGLTPGLSEGRWLNSGHPVSEGHPALPALPCSCSNVDVAEAINSSNRVEATNPETGAWHQLSILTLINYNDFRTVLQDAVRWAGMAGRGNEPRHRGPLCLWASLKWAGLYCRDNP